MSRPVPSLPAVEYPDSDGKPMAENDAQRAAIMYGIGALEVYFEPRRDVYVSGDLLIYYEEGNPRVSVAPDVFVVFGARKRERPSYRTWEEGKGPDFVLEVASQGTWEEDVERKPSVYARLGVKEYWQYDPTGKLLPAHLQGLRLAGRAYVTEPVMESLDGTLTLRSRVLGLELRAKPGQMMRFRDPATGQDLLSHREEHAAHRAAVVRARQESAARRAAESRVVAAEARLAELEALLRESRG